MYSHKHQKAATKQTKQTKQTKGKISISTEQHSATQPEPDQDQVVCNGGHLTCPLCGGPVLIASTTKFEQFVTARNIESINYEVSCRNPECGMNFTYTWQPGRLPFHEVWNNRVGLVELDELRQLYRDQPIPTWQLDLNQQTTAKIINLLNRLDEVM